MRRWGGRGKEQGGRVLKGGGAEGMVWAIREEGRWVGWLSEKWVRGNKHGGRKIRRWRQSVRVFPTEGRKGAKKGRKE